jgi:hypothetical protein
MMKKRFWQNHNSWEEAERAWDEGAKDRQKSHPLKVLPSLPSMPAMTADTARHLKWKSLKWMVTKDQNWQVTKHILKRPFFYLYNYLKSLVKRKSYVRDGDFFLYGVPDVATFEKLASEPNTLLILGFSYCEKPHECPSKRFTPDCIHDPEHPVCRQCFIGKAVNALRQERAIPLFIPTIHYISEKIFEILEANPEKRLLFIITACEMTLEMFGDWGNLSGICGIGVRLDGRICNTMKAFELSENGIKPGLTVVLEETQKRILDLLKKI